MDASQYLRKQGWRGQGHSLDHTGRGIKKPLLISKKVDALGVGLNKHAAVSDQWWLRAFDNGLKTFGTGSDSKLAQVQKYGHKRSGLYDRFVRGASMPGSIGKDQLSQGGETTSADPSGANGAAVRQSDRLYNDISSKSLHTQGQKEPDGTSTRKRSSSTIGGPAARDDRKRKRKGGDEGKRSRQKIDTSSIQRDAQQKAGMGKSRPSETKGAKYARRAAEMGLSVEDYAIRRQRKKEAKASAIARGSVDNIKPLEIEVARDTPFESKDYPGATEFADLAIRAISNNQTITIAADDGVEAFVWQANDPIPLDTRIWEGAKVNTLPKVIRRARQAWMKSRRDAKKADKGRGVSLKQPRADRKHQEQESLAINILKRSRHLKAGGHPTEAGVTSGKSFGEVPVVEVAGLSGPFSNEEMARARAVARRLLRHAKKEAKREAKGKGRESVQGSHAGKPSKRTSLSRASKYAKRAESG